MLARLVVGFLLDATGGNWVYGRWFEAAGAISGCKLYFHIQAWGREGKIKPGILSPPPLFLMPLLPWSGSLSYATPPHGILRQVLSPPYPDPSLMPLLPMGSGQVLSPPDPDPFLMPLLPMGSADKFCHHLIRILFLCHSSPWDLQTSFITTWSGSFSYATPPHGGSGQVLSPPDPDIFLMPLLPMGDPDKFCRLLIRILFLCHSFPWDARTSLVASWSGSLSYATLPHGGSGQVLSPPDPDPFLMLLLPMGSADKFCRHLIRILFLCHSCPWDPGKFCRLLIRILLLCHSFPWDARTSLVASWSGSWSEESNQS
jgi:hypothetical protein